MLNEMELREWDWVYFNGIPARVKEINHNREEVTLYPNRVPERGSLRGMRLTYDDLDANGFGIYDVPHDGRIIYVHRSKKLRITKYHDKSGYYTDNGMKVEYIHELQHIMQDAGIESGGRTFIGF